MKHLGFVLFLVGLTVASWFSSKVVEPPADETDVAQAPDPIGTVTLWAADAGLGFLGGIALMVIGGIVARRAAKSTGGDTADTGAQRDDALELLDGIIQSLDDMKEDTLPAESQTLADQLEALLTDQVPKLIDRRELLIDTWGLEAFAEMIGHFASMERGSARAWSAIIDEAWDEVAPSLARARKAVQHARDVAEIASEAS